MKKFTALLLLLALASSIFSGTALAGKSESPENGTEGSAAAEFEGILASDATASEFLHGYWTNGRSDYIYVEDGDGILLDWTISLPYPVCNIYVLEDGVLRGKTLTETSEVETRDILSIKIKDEDTIDVYSFYTDEETEFKRDSLVYDPENLSNSYVFRTKDRGFAFLTGEWMTADMDWFIIAADEYGNMSLNTSLPCPEGEGMDFCDKRLCASTQDPETGKKTFTEAYGFNIVDKNNISVKCYENGERYVFQRISGEIDSDNLDTEYVFFCDSRAYSYLEGGWKESEGDKYYLVQNDSGNVTWRTNLPLEKHSGYTYAQGALNGIDTDGEENTVLTPIYEFEIISRDELKVHVISDGSDHVLVRQQAEDE